MVAGEGRGDLRTEEELVFNNAMFTLLAGHETTMNMIGKRGCSRCCAILTRSNASSAIHR